MLEYEYEYIVVIRKFTLSDILDHSFLRQCYSIRMARVRFLAGAPTSKPKFTSDLCWLGASYLIVVGLATQQRKKLVGSRIRLKHENSCSLSSDAGKNEKKQLLILEELLLNFRVCMDLFRGIIWPIDCLKVILLSISTFINNQSGYFRDRN